MFKINLCILRNGKRAFFNAVELWIPIFAAVDTASTIRRPKNPPRTTLEKPRHSPGAAKATQEAPRTPQEIPKRSQWTARNPKSHPKASQKAPKPPQETIPDR